MTSPDHAHDHTDEFFLVLEGTLHLDLPDGTVTLRQGGTYTVPRGGTTGEQLVP